MRVQITNESCSTIYEVDEIVRYSNGTIICITRSGNQVEVNCSISVDEFNKIALNGGVLVVEDRPSSKVVTAKCSVPIQVQNQPVSVEQTRPLMQTMEAVSNETNFDYGIPIGPIKHKDALKQWFDSLAAHEKLNVYVCNPMVTDLIDRGENEWEDKLSPEIQDIVRNVYRNKNSRSCLLYFNAFVRFLSVDDLKRISETYPWFDMREVPKYTTEDKQKILVVYDPDFARM